MKPAEVLPEWERTRALLGSPEEALAFVESALKRFGAPLDPTGRVRLAHLDALDAPLRERLANEGLEGKIAVATEDPAPHGAERITRAHPLTAALASALFEGALEPELLSDMGLGRVGAWPTRAVERVTHVALLRLRFKLASGRGGGLLLAEEAAVIALSGSKIVATDQDARALLSVQASSNLDPSARNRSVRQAHERLPDFLAGPLAEHARARAAQLAEDHARVRAAAEGSARVAVEAVLPPDVIGLFTLLPEID